MTANKLSSQIIRVTRIESVNCQQSKFFKILDEFPIFYLKINFVKNRAHLKTQKNYNHISSF